MIMLMAGGGEGDRVVMMMDVSLDVTALVTWITSLCGIIVYTLATPTE